MIRLRILGAMDLHGPDGGKLRAVLAQPKRLALLAYLAAAHPRGLHSRDTLLALLWPDLTQQRARAALRQALYVLRRALGGEVLVTCGDGVIGLEHRHVWCDAVAFDDAVDAGNWAEALGLYGGELLAGFHVPGTGSFERWADAERARLAARAASAAWALSERDEGRGDLTGALVSMRRQLEIDPYDERAIRRAITLFDRLGDRVAALRIYREFAARIEEDFALEPASETRALVAAIWANACRPKEAEVGAAS